MTVLIVGGIILLIVMGFASYTHYAALNHRGDVE
jgi:hypothetical protein